MINLDKKEFQDRLVANLDARRTLDEASERRTNRQSWITHHLTQAEQYRRAARECEQRAADLMTDEQRSNKVTTAEQISRNKQRFDSTIAEIQENRDLNEEAKQRMISEVYEQSRGEHAKLAEQARAEAEKRVNSARKQAFAPPRMKGADPATVYLSYRDALDRVGQTREPDKLAEILSQADITGDEVLAKAVLIRAYEVQNEALVGDYLKNRPEETRSYEKFTDAAEEFNILERQTQLFGTLGPRKP